jgi:hypothetical protein
MTQDEERTFEDEVRRVARQLWPEDQFAGAREIGGRERDGIFVTEDLVNILECTVSRRKDKAADEQKKIADAARLLEKEYPDKLLKGWFVTREEPTVDQRKEIDKSKNPKITACSFETFRRRLINAADYLDCRNRYRFGSVVNLVDGTPVVLDNEYIDIDIFDNSEEQYNIKRIAKDIMRQSERFLLLGDYGAGKSMTLRQIYFELRRAYHKKESLRFPVYLNLRDHHSQRDPHEVLTRHAALVGFPGREQLVRAWRAGYVDLLLDGFDELATAAWLGIAKKLKQIRFQTMELVRKLIQESPRSVGVILAGRRGYFDNDREMRQGLDPAERLKELSLRDLSEEQLRRYLERKGLARQVPDWIPARPLLVGYLAAKNSLDGIAELASMPPAHGWYMLFARICHREAEIEANLEPGAVQAIIERLATLARARSDSLGPIYPDDIRLVFKEIVGYEPDDRGQMLLMRLPGLGPHAPDDGSRRFVDPGLADVAAAGDFYRFIEDPFNQGCLEHLSKALNGIGGLGISVTAMKCADSHFGESKIATAIKRSREMVGADILKLDLLDLLVESEVPYRGEKVNIREVIVDRLDVPGALPNVSRFSLEDCIISHIGFDPDIVEQNMPRFVSCEIASVEGRISIHDLPRGVFDEGCRFGMFADARTNSAIFSLDLPEGTRVLLSILTKLFLQSGSGRREGALGRGLDHRSRRLVPDILNLLQRRKIAFRTHQAQQALWIPLRDQSARVRRILASPSTSNDSLLREAGEID